MSLPFRHSAKSSIILEECQIGEKLKIPHAIKVRLHAHQVDVVSFTPKMADIVGVLNSSLSLSVGISIQDEAMCVAQSTP